MPNRIVREGFLDSEAINTLEPFTECIFHRLLIVSDDAGRFDGRSLIVASRCYPLKDSIRAKDVEGHLLKLEQAGLLIRYEWNGKPFLQLTKWQKCGKSLTSKYPWKDGGFSITYAKAETRDGVKEIVTTSLSHAHPITTPLTRDSRESNTETETETETETARARTHDEAAIPTLQEVLAYADQIGATQTTAKNFFDWYEGKNLWLNKHQKLINWRHELAVWRERDKTGFGKNGNNRSSNNAVDRNQGTANAGLAHLYENVGRVDGVQNPE